MYLFLLDIICSKVTVGPSNSNCMLFCYSLVESVSLSHRGWAYSDLVRGDILFKGIIGVGVLGTGF